MRRSMLCFAALCSVIVSGCATKRPARGIDHTIIDLVIGPECKATTTLLDCNLSTDPPKCRGTRVEFPRGCEQLAVRR